jgi:2-desacetyl-2-hydroxyethyl bacteriochlorophyllide A dehydrogenase
MRSRAVWFVAPHRVEVRDARSSEPGPGQVLVRTERSGISGGTEMLAYRGQLDPAMPRDDRIRSLEGTFAFPFRYGYAAVGIVERSLTSIPEGARVFAFHPHQDRFVAAEEDVVPVPGLDPRTAVLFPLVETAVQVCADVAARPGEPVVCVGLGAVGLLVGTLLRRAGVEMLGADPLAWRRSAAIALGIRAFTPEDLRGAVEDATGGRGVGRLVEASGHPGALGPSLPLLAYEGTAFVCSWYGARPVPLPLGAEFHRRRLGIRSTQVSLPPEKAEWRDARRETARDLLGELPIELLATHETPLERAADAYEAIDRRQEGLIHMALSYA